MKQNWSMVFCALLIMSLGANPVRAQMFINEIYLDPPGASGDLVFEYIELRGEPNSSLTDHYLIVLENEQSATANPGLVESIFDLGSLGTPNLGANGFLTLRQAGPSEADYSALHPESNNLKNSGSSFTWGSGPTSTIGFTDEGNDGVLENSGGTFMLIKNNGGLDTAPVISPSPGEPLIDLDVDDDNELDLGGILDNWTVLDSIGINSESSDINGMLYAPINFSAGTPPEGGNVPEGATFVDVGYEIEYFARWGNSTGSTAADWHISNLTNDEGAGYAGGTDFRQAGDDPHELFRDDQFVETTQGLPYGTIIPANMGSENLFILDGDYNAAYDGAEFVFDQAVDGRDFLHWQRNNGFGLGPGDVPLYATRKDGDGNSDRVVDGDDLAVWIENYGTSLAPESVAITQVPEPSVLGLILTGLLSVVGRCRA